MYRVLFPELRASRMYLWYQRILNPMKLTRIYYPKDSFDLPPLPELTPIPAPMPGKKPFYMALKTNMLYDALLVPNAGVGVLSRR